MPDEHALTPETLLAHQAWVERLARGLVRDSSLAQDLAQETWLQASRGERALDATSLRAYLGGMLNNLRRASWRAGERRARREARAARPEALPSPAELVERAELQRLLVESVLALPEAERTAVLLHYFEGVPSEEIARRAGIPSATVRSRIHRGLEHLRTRLSARVPREDLLAGLLVLARFSPSLAPVAPDDASGARPAASPSPLPWIGGLLAMKTLPMIVAGCAALALAGLWTLTRGGDNRGAEPAPELARVEPTGLVPAAPPSALDAASSAPRTSVAVEQSHAPAAEPEATPAALAHVEARVLDASGNPLAEVEVRADDELLQRTGLGGRVVLALPVARENEFELLEFHRPGFARERRGLRLRASARIPLGDVVLGEAGTIRGRVEDERGRGVPHVRVMATGLENARTDPEELRRLGPEEDERAVASLTAEDGSFELADVPTGPARLWAGGGEHAWSSVGPLEVAAAGIEGTRIELHPLDTVDRISGIALDPEGEPVPGAWIHTWFTAASFGQGGSLKTDAAGRFEIRLQQRVNYDLTLQDEENRWSEVYAFGVEPGTHDLELHFEPVTWLDVSVRDPEGHPLPDASLGLEAADPSLRVTALSERTAEGGLRMRLPNTRFSVTAEAPRREYGIQGPFDPFTAPPRIEFTLRALGGILGIVRDDSGQPVAGVEVGLYRAVADTLVVESDGFRLRTEGSTQIKTETDAGGRFALYPAVHRGPEIASDAFVLRATTKGWAPTELPARRYDVLRGEEVELRLQRGGAIEGCARLAPGVDPAGIVLAFHRGDGKARTVRLDSDGCYRLEGLTPGGWNVEALEDEIHGHRSSSSASYYEEGAPPFEEPDCIVVDGQTTRLDVDLGDLAPCTLRGRLTLVGGDVTGWTASLELDGEDAVPAAALDSDGSFTLVAGRGERYRLVLRAPEGGHGRIEVSEDLVLAPGTRAWELELPVGRLDGEGAVGRGTRERFYRYTWTGSIGGHGLRARARLVPDPAGHFELAPVPAGPGTLSCNDPVGQGQEFAEWETVAEFEVPAGGAHTLVIHN